MQKVIGIGGRFGRTWRALVLPLVFAASSHGAVITLDATTRGWMWSDNSNGALPYNNYIAGLAGTTSATERRNFFTFAIPMLDGPVISAVLTLQSGGVTGPETYQITSVPDGFGFPDLGTGTVYGSRDYTSADIGTLQSISLNADGIAAIASNSIFRIGGRITTLSVGGLNEFIFGSTEISGATCAWGVGLCVSQLQITTRAASGSVPEPGTWVLLGLGLAGLAAFHRRVETKWTHN